MDRSKIAPHRRGDGAGGLNLGSNGPDPGARESCVAKSRKRPIRSAKRANDRANLRALRDANRREPAIHGVIRHRVAQHPAEEVPSTALRMDRARDLISTRTKHEWGLLDGRRLGGFAHRKIEAGLVDGHCASGAQRSRAPTAQRLAESGTHTPRGTGSERDGPEPSAHSSARQRQFRDVEKQTFLLQRVRA
jgi:hypothetical protein